jgi:hypothetical protein
VSVYDKSNRTEHNRHLCKKTAVLSCHRSIIHCCWNNKQKLNIYSNFNHHMSLNKSKFCILTTVYNFPSVLFHWNETLWIRPGSGLISDESHIGEFGFIIYYFFVKDEKDILKRYILYSSRLYFLLHWCLICAVLLYSTQKQSNLKLKTRTTNFKVRLG